MKNILMLAIKTINNAIKCLMISMPLLFLNVMAVGAEEKIAVFPQAPYDRFIIYQALIIFWIGIIGLIVILKMKLKELERVQDMGIDREEKDIPFLD